MRVSSGLGPTNAPALNAWRHLQEHQRAFATATERLASGLRINGASDDPTGLVIAERHSAQRRGLEQAVSNIEQGVSLLQTAESSILAIVDIVHAIREKAVEAASATSQEARNTAQVEVDAWLAEIDREARDAEFSGLSLLDGSLTALASTTNAALAASIRGTAAADGEYNVEVGVAPGAGQALASGPFTLRATSNTQYASGARGRALDVSENLVTAYGAGHPALAEDDFTLWLDQEWSTIDWGESGNTANRDFRLTTSQTTGAGDDAFALSAYDVADDSVGAHANFAVATAGNLASSVRSYMRVELTSVTGTNTTATAITLDGAATQSATFKVTRLGESGTAEDAAITLTGAQLVAAQDLPNLVGSAGYTNVYANANSNSRVTMGAAGEVWEVGDALLFTLDPGASFTAGQQTVRALREAPGRDDFPGADTTGASLSSGVATYQPTRVGLRSFTSASVANLDGHDVSVSLPYLDASSAGQVGTGRFRFGELGDTIGAAPRTVEFNLNETDLAERVTELQNVSSFESGGVGVFDAGARTVYLHGRGLAAAVHLSGEESLEDAAELLRDAMRLPSISGGLDLSVDGDLSRWTGVDANFAAFVDNATAGTQESLVSSLVLRSPLTGADGSIRLSGDGDVISAFAFVEIAAPESSQLDVTVTEARTGQVVGRQSAYDGKIRNLPSGVDLAVDLGTEITVGWDNTEKELTFTSGPGTETHGLHVASNLLSLQVGANAGQTIDAPIAQIDTETLGLAGMLVVDQESATESIDRADRALEALLTEAAKVGSYVNRLQSAEALTEIAAEHATAAEGAIRNVDMAREAINWMSSQLLVNQATAMLSQANVQPSRVWSLLLLGVE